MVHIAFGKLLATTKSISVTRLLVAQQMTACQQGRNEGARGGIIPRARITMGAPNHHGGR